MRITSKYSINQSITEWTLNKLKSNPELYGGDNGNNEIILAYLKETNPFGFVIGLSSESIGHCVAVSRCKNKLLVSFPEYDYRVKNKPKSKKQKIKKDEDQDSK